MNISTLAWLFSAAAAFSGDAEPDSAEATAPIGPDAFELVYNEPTNVNLGGRPVTADIAYFIDSDGLGDGQIRLALVTDVTAFIQETQDDLKWWVSTNQDRCGQRWSAGEPIISFPDEAIRFQLELALEVYNCGWNRKSDPSRMAREAGAIDVTLSPYVENGRLQSRLEDFSIDQRAGVSKYLPLEFVAKRVIENEIAKLNKNRKFYRAPSPLTEAGLSYEAIYAEKTETGRVVVTAIYKGSGDQSDIEALIEKTETDGITQER